MKGSRARHDLTGQFCYLIPLLNLGLRFHSPTSTPTMVFWFSHLLPGPPSMSPTPALLIYGLNFLIGCDLIKVGIRPFYLLIFLETVSNCVDQTNFELTEVCLPMPSKCWDLSCATISTVSFQFTEFH